ncbi:virulence RhuM family protein [Ruminococcus sp.]|uniref:virulence RhuM family protein n=1 Tax=Ruminococcus sp. TaxID=41978 RepID=UPI0038690D66
MENSQIIMYQTEDGLTKIDVKLENETVWLNQLQMAELFQRDKSTISRHIKNIFDERELDKDSVVAKIATTAADGKLYDVEYYSLDVIISVGYRVKSLRGTQFRIWANRVLKEYLIKGFAMNDDLLKSSGGGDYFKELLERIRDIRSSERVFYRQILDIYATSIDYDKNAETSILFFKTVQNKMHFAVSGHTAPEIIYLRADSTKPFMGMTNFKGKRPQKSEIATAKNYLSEQELKELNAITSAYLDFAELQALRRKTMTMQDWIAKLDDFLHMSDSEILQNAGTISHEMALEKAQGEYKKYKKQNQDDLSQVERDFLDSVKKTQKQLESKKRP